MKIDINKKELFDLREVVIMGCTHYTDDYYSDTGMFPAGLKLLKKINRLIVTTHGHDCSGEKYVEDLLNQLERLKGGEK